MSGFMIYGAFDLNHFNFWATDPDFTGSGAPVNFKPASVTGFFKFPSPVSTDIAKGFVILKKFNTQLGISEEVGRGELEFNPTTTYTPFTIVVNDLQPGIMPDSIVVCFSSGMGYSWDAVSDSPQLGVLYNTEEVPLTDTTNIADRFKTLVIIRPTDSIPPSHLQKLDGFLSNGGKLVVAINRVNGDLQNASGFAVTTGLETWLQQKGILVEDNFVVDAKCGSVNVVQQQGGFSFQSQISFPYLPVVGKFADHPISKGLESVLFEFVSTVSYMGDTTKKFTPLAFTSEQSSALKAPQYFNIQKQWTQADLPLSNLVMAAAVEGKLVGNALSKLVVIGDGDFAISGPQQRGQRRPMGQIELQRSH